MRSCQGQHLKDALDNGLTLLSISAKAVARFGTLPQRIQAAENAIGAAHQKEDAFQILHQVQSIAASMAATKQTVDWDCIKCVVGVKTQCSADDLGPIVALAHKFGNRPSSNFADDLARFKVFWATRRKYDAASSGRPPHRPRGFAPIFVYEVIKRQASCHKDKGDGNVAKFITARKINALATSRESSM